MVGYGRMWILLEYIPFQTPFFVVWTSTDPEPVKMLRESCFWGPRVFIRSFSLKVIMGEAFFNNDFAYGFI